ncbi:MAG: hypothetical protein M3N13_01220, partial [Candidatus Eremiobacteraeota bacterium]|nr:hypothetical protein [Candidatus Eremiobacteraeota bacterium]
RRGRGTQGQGEGKRERQTASDHRAPKTFGHGRTVPRAENQADGEQGAMRSFSTHWLHTTSPSTYAWYAYEWPHREQRPVCFAIGSEIVTGGAAPLPPEGYRRGLLRGTRVRADRGARSPGRRGLGPGAANG